MNYLYALAIFAAFLALGLFIARRKNMFEKRVDIALASGLSVWSDRMVDVAREVGTKPLSHAQLKAIDQALTNVYARAAERGYRRFLDHSVYTVVILKSELYKDIPVFRMPDGEYVVGAGYSMKERIFAVAECGDDQLQALTTAVENEAEHVLLYANDRDLFNKTKIHKDGEGHPLF